MGGFPDGVLALGCRFSSVECMPAVGNVDDGEWEAELGSLVQELLLSVHQAGVLLSDPGDQQWHRQSRMDRGTRIPVGVVVIEHGVAERNSSKLIGRQAVESNSGWVSRGWSAGVL